MPIPIPKPAKRGRLNLSEPLTLRGAAHKDGGVGIASIGNPEKPWRTKLAELAAVRVVRIPTELLIEFIGRA